MYDLTLWLALHIPDKTAHLVQVPQNPHEMHKTRLQLVVGFFNTIESTN